ncbi:MAG TPA: hypothetical protein DGH68_04315 [Bacteroidetes bacterium]|jgi:hypothetical protein|nr:hypothetical protein [Bacteroidota bacterium]
MITVNEQLAWMAGIADGEGSFYLSATKDNRNRPVVKYSFAVGNTNIAIILEVKRIFEMLIGHSVNYCPCKGRGNRKSSWVIALTSLRDLVVFCHAVMPFLVGKREQAETMLEFAAIGKAKGNHWTGRNSGVYEQRFAFVEKMKAINRYRTGDTPARDLTASPDKSGEGKVRTARQRAEAAETTARQLKLVI